MSKQNSNGNEQDGSGLSASRKRLLRRLLILGPVLVGTVAVLANLATISESLLRIGIEWPWSSEPWPKIEFELTPERPRFSVEELAFSIQSEFEENGTATVIVETGRNEETTLVIARGAPGTVEFTVVDRRFRLEAKLLPTADLIEGTIEDTAE